MTDRDILLQLIASLTLCDHMGDVCDSIQKTLDLLSIKVDEWNDLYELGSVLGKMGITTLYGTELWDEEDGRV